MKPIQFVFISLITLFVFIANGQKVYRYKKVSFFSDTNIFLTKKPLSKISGTVIRKEKNSKFIWEVKNGKLHGNVVYYFKNHKKFEAEYLFGKQLKSTSYHPLSNIIESDFKFNDYNLLNYKVNYSDGKTRYEGSNDLNGNPKGTHNVFFEDGKLKIRVSFWEKNNQEEKAFYESIPKGKCSLFTTGIGVSRSNWTVDDMQWYYTSMPTKDTSKINSEEKAKQQFEYLTLKQNNIQRIEFFNSKGDIIYSENWPTWTNGEFIRLYDDKKVIGKIEKTWIETSDICEISIIVKNLSCYDLKENPIPCNE
ncbi:MAG: hypothetical protein ACOVQG_04805 [Crocinitomicaceae bacterium]|jgi:hypothetical protein